MSIPLDRLYHYIQDVAEQVHGDCILIYRFAPHGSKKLEDLKLLDQKKYRADYIISPQVFCYDQEPLNYDFYQDSTYVNIYNLRKKIYQTELTQYHRCNIRILPKNIYDKCLLLHSEQNSADVVKYKQSHFIPVYYWSHAVIALDWFRYAKFVDIKVNTPQKQFLIYNRAWAGSREYRLKFTELLQKNNLAKDCQTSFNPVDPEDNILYTDHIFKNANFKSDIDLTVFPVTSATSTASADFTIEDYAKTKFEVVLETLFDDSRIQLTEKSLRPIACGHPFIIASTPGSLKYLQTYGFKTFNGIIDESYDNERDPIRRLNLIIDEMKKITSWSADEHTINWAKIKEITEYNKKHFFSNVFFNSVVSELRTNLASAFNELENTNTSRTFIEKRIEKYNLINADPEGGTDWMRDDVTFQMTVLAAARRYYNRWRNSINSQ
jgi:hypothetical protein